MEKLQKTLKGFAVRRRCDVCGTRIDVAVDEGEKCLLKCSQCGKEYRFHVRTEQDPDTGFSMCFALDGMGS